MQFLIKKNDIAVDFKKHVGENVAVGFIVKNLFNNIDLGIMCMSILRSTVNSFDSKFLLYKGNQINILRKVNEIVIDVGESFHNLISYDNFHGILFHSSDGNFGYRLIEDADEIAEIENSIKETPKQPSRKEFLDMKKEFSQDSIAVDNIYDLGQLCFLEISDFKVGILSSSLTKASMNVLHIKENKNNIHFKDAMLQVVKFVNDA